MNQDIQNYIDDIDEKYKDSYIKLLNLIIEHIPKGFELVMQYNMPSFVVPKKLYPQGYHVDPNQPLPFLALGVQKHHIGLYHLGIYADPKLLSWFEDQYSKQVPTKLDMGKSCIRLKNPKKIPFDLIGELASKMSADEWIEIYSMNK